MKSMIKVVGVFPDRSSVFRLVGRNLNELDGYRRANRNYSQQESMQLIEEEEVISGTETFSIPTINATDS